MESELRETYAAIGSLMGAMGIMDAVVDAAENPTLTEGWSEKLGIIRRWAEEQASEFADFGSALDREDQRDDADRL